jgi:hypothetical protein
MSHIEATVRMLPEPVAVNTLAAAYSRFSHLSPIEYAGMLTRNLPEISKAAGQLWVCRVENGEIVPGSGFMFHSDPVSEVQFEGDVYRIFKNGEIINVSQGMRTMAVAVFDQIEGRN